MLSLSPSLNAAIQHNHSLNGGNRLVRKRLVASAALLPRCNVAQHTKLAAPTAACAQPCCPKSKPKSGRCRPQRSWGSSSLPPHQKASPSCETRRLALPLPSQASPRPIASRLWLGPIGKLQPTWYCSILPQTVPLPQPLHVGVEGHHLLVDGLPNLQYRQYRCGGRGAAGSGPQQEVLPSKRPIPTRHGFGQAERAPRSAQCSTQQALQLAPAQR